MTMKMLTYLPPESWIARVLIGRGAGKFPPLQCEFGGGMTRPQQLGGNRVDRHRSRHARDATGQCAGSQFVVKLTNTGKKPVYADADNCPHRGRFPYSAR